jgi:outer membrane murein-binding lipoprotein Lpp
MFDTPHHTPSQPEPRPLVALVHRIPWGIAVVALTLLAGCRDSPEDVIAQARQTLAAKDDAGFLTLLEPKSAAFLQAAPDVVNKSGKVYRVLRDGRPTTALLPKGEAVEVVEQGTLAVVMFKQGQETARVPLRLIEGQWRIDLLESDLFLQALQPRE